MAEKFEPSDINEFIVITNESKITHPTTVPAIKPILKFKQTSKYDNFNGVEKQIINIKQIPKEKAIMLSNLKYTTNKISQNLKVTQPIIVNVFKK